MADIPDFCSFDFVFTSIDELMAMSMLVMTWNSLIEATLMQMMCVKW